MTRHGAEPKSALAAILDSVTEYAVVTASDDGTLRVRGIFNGEYAAVLWANDHETEGSGLTCHVLPVEPPD